MISRKQGSSTHFWGTHDPFDAKEWHHRDVRYFLKTAEV